MSQNYEKLNIENKFDILNQQLIILNEKLEILKNKIDNINFNFKIIDFINKEKYKYEIDWNSIHLY